MSSGVDVVRACRKLYAAIDTLDQVAAEAVGVSRGDLRCLNLLEHGPMAPKEIAARLGMTTGSVTALLDRLQNAKLVLRKPAPDDRRALVIEMTPRAFKTLGPIYRKCAVTLETAVAALPREQQSLAVSHIELITRACLAAAHGN
jgi:DNA-binding MarR family transcriptional regulator